MANADGHTGGGNTRGTRERFGAVRRLPSGRYQARYTGPDGATHTGPTTWSQKTYAHAWLREEADLIDRGRWTSPKTRTERTRKVVTFGAYAAAWLAQRDVKDRTREHYRRILERFVLPEFGGDELDAITPARVRAWHATTAQDTPTQRAHAYGLLRTILGTAVADGDLATNPCHIRGAGTTPRRRPIHPLTVDELAALVDAMPEQYQAMTLVAAYCALRFGELVALRRRDVDLDAGVIRVRQAVVRLPGEVKTTTPKSAAGVRDVHMPPLVVDALRAHLQARPVVGDGLVFPGPNGGVLAPATLYGRAPSKTRRGRKVTERAGWGFYGARAAIGRPDLRWHDLRHTGAVLAAQAGATLAELMGRLGHSTPQAALRYQHASSARDALIASKLGPAKAAWADQAASVQSRP